MKNGTSLCVGILSILLITTGGVAGLLAFPAKAVDSPQQIDPVASDSFDSTIAWLMKISHISALSGAIVHNGSLVWAKGYGLADRESSTNATAETVYLVASISKTFTATALMQLYEQGRFGLDDDVSNYLDFTVRNPAFPAVPITFRMLLAHHSSLSKDPETSFTRIFPADLQLGSYPHTFYKELLVPGGLQYIPQVWTTKTPGSTMNYANLGFGLLGLLVERISGENFAAYCHNHIFLPLEMYNTSFTLEGLPMHRLARPYDFYQRAYVPYMHYTLLDYPAGGLRTTVLDLSHFLIAQMNQGRYKNVQLLKPETIQEMHTVQYQNHTGYNFNYGLGFQIWEAASGNQIGHSGGLYGVSTIMVYREGRDVGIIMFCDKQTKNPWDRVEFSLLVLCINAKAQRLTGLPQETNLREILPTTQFLLQEYASVNK